MTRPARCHFRSTNPQSNSTPLKSFLRIALVSTLLVGVNVLAITGCAATSTRESTGEFIDDATITTKVKAAFVTDEAVKAREISVETFKGVVQLSGFVNTPAEKAAAAKLAAGVTGVRSVKNSIAVK